MSEIELKQRQCLVNNRPLEDVMQDRTEIAKVIVALIDEIKRLHNELAAPQQKKRKKSKWHPADERPMRSKSFPDYSVDVIGEVCDSLEVVYWNDHRKIWKGGLAMPKGVKRWRFLKKFERKGHDWQGEPWPDEGGEDAGRWQGITRN